MLDPQARVQAWMDTAASVRRLCHCRTSRCALAAPTADCLGFELAGVFRAAAWASIAETWTVTSLEADATTAAVAVAEIVWVGRCSCFCCCLAWICLLLPARLRSCRFLDVDVRSSTNIIVAVKN